MADDVSDKRCRRKKKRSSLLTWKKKFNIKKRFTNKLPVHRRHIRALMSSWSLPDVRSVLNQYEITTMLKQLSLMADKSRLPCSNLGQDLYEMYKQSSCCDLKITCCEMAEDKCLLSHTNADHINEFKVHRALVSVRWPYLRGVMKSQLAKQKQPILQESPNSAAGPVKADANLQRPDQKTAARFWKIHINGITSGRLTEFLNEVYNTTKNGSTLSQPRKLLPLPTTDDSLHIRNSRGKQAFRHTVFECDPPPPVLRRSVVRRKHNKHRFSMDERILCNQHVAPGFSRGNQEIRSSKLSPSEICNLDSHNLDSQFASVTSGSTQKHQSEKPLPNSIQDDLMRMYQDAKSGCGDVKIIFTCDSPSQFISWMTPRAKRRDFSNHYQAWISHYESSNFFHSSSREWQDPLYCHKVVIAARSPYFRRLVEKQISSPTWWDDSHDTIPTLEIDGNVIPPRYMGAVLYTMYSDKVDILRLYERIGQGGMPVGGMPSHFHLRDAMMLHHIGCFIEFSQLVNACEEFIVSCLDQNNLPQILHWASLPHGSEWVKRQVNNFIRERFTVLSSTGVLFELGAPQIVEVLKSDFVNASELDILKCALRWGEHELLRRIEEREPNLLTHTAHSVSRSKTASARRRELIASKIEELHECTAPVLACVRMQHLLPPNHELFMNAEKRGVISRPPADLLENVNDRESCARQWIKSRVDFVPPRLFQPYMDEAKNILDERFAQESDCVSLRSMHSFSRDQTWCSVRHQMELTNHGIPDALYMVGQARLPTRRRYGNRDLHSSFFPPRVVIAGRKVPLIKFIGNFHPVPDVSVLREMMARERELRSTYIVNKVLRACIDCCHSNGVHVRTGYLAGQGTTSINGNSSHEDLDEGEHCNRCTALRLVRLFVVRERGLPDCATDLLQQPEIYYDLDELRGAAVSDSLRVASVMRTERTTRAFGHLDARPLPERIGNVNRESVNLPQDQRILIDSKRSPQPPAYKDPPLASEFWRKQNQLHSDISSSCLNSNIPAALSLTESSSSSEDEEVVRIRWKKRSLSRKGSSSTTSYQSIPDVAASANSSLQRLRDSSSLRVSEELPNSPLVTSNFNYAATSSPTSTSSSCEENTSENEIEPASSPYCSYGVFVSEAAEATTSLPHCQILPGLLPGEYHKEGFVGTPEHEGVRNRPQKIYPPRRPLSADMSELFESSLNFIDDNVESSEDSAVNVRSSQRFQSLELDKDETLPRVEARNDETFGRSTSFCEKLDVYPAGNESSCLFNDQCGQYFFCSLTREKMSKNENGRRSKKSVSFAINNEKPEASKNARSNERGSTNLAFLGDETIFL